MDELEDDLDRYCRARVGTKIRDKWHLDRVLGIGGMAAVYAASHRNGSTAALKVLHPQYAAVTSMRDRFLREAYIANKAGHEGIVKVHDDEVDDYGSPYLVMELLDGTSVADRADAIGGRLPAREAVWVGQELLGILEAAHAQGIVHRDIKPDNLFWTKDDRLKVLDFGIARLREDVPSKKTRTGMVFGTPGYMAPEQALGRWSLVDARTDLWAVGATIFNLLTGESVHEGETDNERLVNAATRPARSLGRAIRWAPVELVQVIDRSLAFDPSHRYPDARTMCLDLTHAAPLVAGLDRSGPATRSFSPTAPTQVEAAGPPGAAPPAEEPEPPELDALVAESTPAARAAMVEIFALLEKAMKARSQYGKAHKEVERRQDMMFAAVSAALLAHPNGLAWHVRAYGFTALDETLWEPKAPLDQVTYRLFSDGVRSIGILPGIRQDELAELTRILVAEASTEISPEDNLVTLLWDAGFDHVLYEEGDAFAEGDQAERAAFQKRRAEVLAGAELDTADQLEDAWRAHNGKPGDHEAKQRALLGALGSSASAALQASSMRTSGAGSSPPPAGLAMRAVTEARLAAAAVDSGDRFAIGVAAAFVMAFRRGEPGLVATPVRTAMDGLPDEAAADTLAFLALLETSVQAFATEAERGAVVAALVNALVSPKRLLALAAAVAAPDAKPELFDRFSAVLSHVDGSHISGIAALFASMDPSPLRNRLLTYIADHAQGQEGEIGATFAKGHLEPSLALLKVLTRLGTPAAREAAREATRSPHPLVRIEALGLFEGASGLGIRQALRAMLEDWDPAVRLAALQSIGNYRVKVAGPALVMRVKSPEFDGLPLDERREALHALYSLTASRAEALSIELLADTRLVTGDAHEQTRGIAAEMLGLHGRTSEGRAALEAASRGRWKNSERVRAAAAAALKAWDERGTRESEPPPSSQVGTELPLWGRASQPPTASASSYPAVRPPSTVPPPTSKR